MKRTAKNFLIYFALFFGVNLLGNAILKDEPNIPTAFSVALGVALGIAIVEQIINKKLAQK